MPGIVGFLWCRLHSERPTFKSFSLWLVLGFVTTSWIEWNTFAEASPAINFEGKVFYTNDVGLFSSSRRLSLQEDPTQPVLDVSDQSDDVVFEPEFMIHETFTSLFGNCLVALQGQGFVFTEQTQFNHGTYGLRIEQTFTEQTILGLRFHYGPSMFLGDNEDRRPGRDGLTEERVTTYFWAGTLERNIVKNLRLRLLSRYGLRRYNEKFAHRNTNFWTVGPHVDWTILPGLWLRLGYHFEQGLADGRHRTQFRDDVSYINHYASTELEVEIGETTTMEFAIHYERNDFTSDIAQDERNGATEDVFQGDIEIRHRLADHLEISVGFQRSQRKISFEPSTVIDINTWGGIRYQFH